MVFLFMLGGSVILGILAMVGLKMNKWEPITSILWIVSIGLFMLFWKSRGVVRINWLERVIVFGVIFLVLNFRLTTFPGGVWTDEVENSLAGKNLLIKMVEEKKFVPFSPEATGHPALSLIVNGLATQTIGRSIMALRLPEVLAAAISVVVFFGLINELFGKKAAILATVLYGSSYWLVSLSRIGYDAAYFWLIETLALLNLARFWKKGETRYLVLVSFWLGLGLYTYLAFRTLAIGVGIIALVVVLKKDNHLAVAAGRLLAMGYIFGLIVAPLFFYARRNPEVVFGRANDVSMFNKKFDGIDRIRMVEENTIKTIGMLFWKGDPNLRHNIAQRPVINFIEGLLFLSGLVIALKNKQYFLIETIVVLGVISVASGIFTYEPPYIIQPHSLRTLGLLPLIYLMVAVAFNEIVKRISWKWVVLLVFIGGIINLKSYFGTKITGQIADAFQAKQTKTARLLAENCGTNPAISRSLISQPHLNFFAPDCKYSVFEKGKEANWYYLNQSDFGEMADKSRATEIKFE